MKLKIALLEDESAEKEITEEFLSRFFMIVGSDMY